MSIYQDENGLWHNKPCSNGKPSSNNWMIYTAYAKLLKLPVDMQKVKEYFEKCKVTIAPGEILVQRHPGQKTPPLSADEAIGALILGLIDYDTLKDNHFVFNGKGKPVTPKLIENIMQGLVQLAIITAIKGKSSRNDFWKNKVVKLYQAAFRFHPGHVYFIKKWAKKDTHKEEDNLARLYIEVTLKKNDPSEVNLLWALAKFSRQNKIADRCNPKRNIVRYFGNAHDFSKAVLE